MSHLQGYRLATPKMLQGEHGFYTRDRWRWAGGSDQDNQEAEGNDTGKQRKGYGKIAEIMGHRCIKIRL